MRALRRRAIAKAAGLKYTTTKDGGCDLTDKHGHSIGLAFDRLDDQEFLTLVKLMKRN